MTILRNRMFSEGAPFGSLGPTTFAETLLFSASGEHCLKFQRSLSLNQTCDRGKEQTRQMNNIESCDETQATVLLGVGGSRQNCSEIIHLVLRPSDPFPPGLPRGDAGDIYTSTATTMLHSSAS